MHFSLLSKTAFLLYKQNFRESKRQTANLTEPKNVAGKFFLQIQSICRKEMGIYLRGEEIFVNLIFCFFIYRSQYISLIIKIKCWNLGRSKQIGIYLLFFKYKYYNNATIFKYLIIDWAKMRKKSTWGKKSKAQINVF